MATIWGWFSNLSNRSRDSFCLLMTLVGIVSTLCTVLGLSFGENICESVWMRFGAYIVTLSILYALIYWVLGKIFESSVELAIRGTKITILYGDIFKLSGWKIIGCDSHFDTRVDDIIISKNSLHGKMMLEHGNITDIEKVIDKEASRRNLTKNNEGLYDFPLGTIIRYDNNNNGETFLLLSMAELDADYKAYTNMAKFESMLVKMWTEIDRVYAGHPIIIPLLGTGITRFEDGFKSPESLLRCLLCTLNGCGISLKSEVKVVIYNKLTNSSLYEYMYMFKH